MADPIDFAEAAICVRVVELCESDEDAEGVNKLAGAVAALKWGPDGGAFHTNSRVRQDTTARNEQLTDVDYHLTEHDELNRRQNPTGFGEEDAHD